jgi:hypothetical protein
MDIKNSNLTQELLHQNFRYEDGKLYWKFVHTGRRTDIEAGWHDNLGYRYIGFGRKTYRSYHLIYMMFHGYLPKLIDHKDGNPANNRIENLREASFEQNSWNQKKRCTNTSGIKGVCWNKKAQKWVARCRFKEKDHFLGLFTDIEKAEQALKDFREENHKEFARHE